MQDASRAELAYRVVAAAGWRAAGCSGYEHRPSSAHRILLALSEAGYVRQDRQTKRYTLGNEFFRLSQIALAKAPLREVALAAMQRLIDTFKESASLCVYERRR